MQSPMRRKPNEIHTSDRCSCKSVDGALCSKYGRARTFEECWTAAAPIGTPLHPPHPSTVPAALHNPTTSPRSPVQADAPLSALAME